MRVTLRMGTLLLALGVVLTGCNQSSDLPSKGGAKLNASSADKGAKATESSSASQVVLGIEGMT
jgi:hypothetical protein